MSTCRSLKWPIHFFVAVAFWNIVGAGLFGFMINPPVAVYYVRGLDLRFWSMNIGLSVTVLLSTLPIGLAQAPGHPSKLARGTPDPPNFSTPILTTAMDASIL